MQQAIAGLAGLVGALLLETWLFIIRTNFEPHPALKKRPMPPKPLQPAHSSSVAPSSASQNEGTVPLKALGTEPKKTR